MSQYIPNTGKSKYSICGIGAAAATFLTVISQLPMLTSGGWSSLISRAVWIAFFGVILLIKWNDLKIHRVTFGFAVVICYFLFVLFAGLFNGGGYRTGLFSCVLLSFFVLMVGLLIGKDLREQDLYLCGRVLVLGCLILGLVLYFDIYRHYDITYVVYAYNSKNSAGVILFTGALVAFVYGWNQKMLHNLLNLLVIVFLLYMVLIMKVRAVIICIPLVALCAILRAPFRKRVWIPLLLLCGALVIALQIDSVYELLIDNILLANRGDDLAAASSGRTDEWAAFLPNLQGKELLGDGVTEKESLIITAYLQCGVFMGTLIISYALWPLVWSLRRTSRTASKHMFLLLIVALSYFVDAIFEQLAPFGPGARCFWLWLLFGVIIARGESGIDISERECKNGHANN